MCEATQLKTCSKCGEEKPLLAFRPKETGKFGVRADCRDCENSQMRERRRATGHAISDSAREAKRARERERQKRPEVREAKRLDSLKYHREKVLPAARALTAEKRIGSYCVVYPISCVVCGTNKVSRKEVVWCSASCAQRYGAEKGVGVAPALTTRGCRDCGVSFQGRAGARYCDGCGETRRKAQRRAGNTKRGSKSMQARARKHGCKREPIWRSKVYDRDKWKCYLCGCKVVRSATYQSNQATLDHVIPLSRGGSHTYDNVRTACQSCNSSKSDKIMNAVQLSIFTNTQGYEHR